MALLSYPANTDAAAGLYVQTPPVPFLGEIFTVAGSILFTLQILAVDRLAANANAARITFVMLATSAVLSLAVGLAWGAAPMYSPRLIAGLLLQPVFLCQFAALALLSTAASMHLMNRYQPFVAPAIATVVYCLEPVFGTAFSVTLGAETLTALTVVGGLVILLAVLLLARS